MKSLSKHIKDNETSLISLNEKLVINKNFKPIKYNVKNWNLRVNEPGFKLLQYEDDPDYFLESMFEAIYTREPIHNSIAQKRFMSNDMPILTKWMDLDGNGNYIVFGYDKKRVNGRFALWFIDESNSNNPLYLSVSSGPRITKTTINMIEKHNCYIIEEDELEYILKFYDEIIKNFPCQ